MTNAFGIESLRDLRTYLASISDNHVATLGHYACSNGRGFWHQPIKRDKASLSSTATCVSSLVRAGLWSAPDHRWGKSKDVAERLLERPWKSAGLEENNPFGLSFIAEGILDLVDAGAYPDHCSHLEIVKSEITPLLVREILSADGPLNVPGAVRIKPYPPSAYLTQLSFRVVRRCVERDSPDLTSVTEAVRKWAFSEINRQIALIMTGSRIADPSQLAYSVVLASSTSGDEQTSPEEKAITGAALSIFFKQQHEDGLWRPSQPLFHYPDVGNAQCFEYELLTQLLICTPLEDELLKYLPHLALAARQLSQTSFELEIGSSSTKVGWASGHHPQIAGPESWSTACVYDFVYTLGRVVAEAVRRALFAELNAPYHTPRRGGTRKAEQFATDFLDAKVNVDGEYKSLRETLWDRFVLPIDTDRSLVAAGGSFRRTTPMSAILFGPPGTSKTQLARLISEHIGWPRLAVDPSYLVQDGLDHLYSKANRLFSMLSMAEQVVVLLDEFDEMGRERTANSDMLSRFITTAMLPKLAAINDERKIVFLLATNNVGSFDAAFSRGGRFDMIIQIMPPSAESKLGNPVWREALARAINHTSARKKQEATMALEDLTFLETQQLVLRLQESNEDALTEIKDARDRGTLARKAADKTWKEQCKEEEMHIRLPSSLRRPSESGGGTPGPVVTIAKKRK